MQTQPQITFHDVDRSAWVENYIDERVQRLERAAAGITRCHVTLNRAQASHRKGNRYGVLIEVHLPPQHDLAAHKEREVLSPHVHLPALINSAFNAIERQLKKTAQIRRGDTKLHEARVERQPER
jgi:ribosome-associated translation inhibitor RaiA